ncbi:MAG: YafY family transcriptional regulator [Actinomycetota bacterium]|nr:YafY family transcriptional regulator [Actinomycetota bacterium]
MAETTARLLGVLSLLQARPRWTGPELADRFDVTVRTVRRDIDRLRRLGYPIVADAGANGGYRLGAGGSAMPPLMLDRDEAVAVAVCLRSTATESIAGGGEAAVRALGKLEQLLPPVLRRQVGTIGLMTARLGAAAATPVAPEVLVTISRACRDSERLRAHYRDGHGRESARTLDPYRIVSTARRWYLVAHDRDRAAWRSFRVDRLSDVTPTGHRVEIVDPPDPVAFVQVGITTSAYLHRAVIELMAPIGELAQIIPPTVGVLEAVDGATTTLTTGADHIETLAFHVLSLGVGFRVVESEALRQHLAELVARAAEAVTASATS